MAASTERVVVLMTAAEKKALDRKAKRIGSSAAELVRRSVASFDPDVDEAEIERMLDVLSISHRAAVTALDRAERELAETRAYFAAKSAGSERGHH
jgi:hypothetical protein